MFSHEKSVDPSQENYEAPKVTLVPPAGEALLHLDNPESLWPDEVKQCKELRSKVEARLELTTDLEKIFEDLPAANTELSEALKLKLVKPETLAKVYNQLTDFLETETGGERILLYLPFEFLPEAQLKTDSTELNLAARRFSQAYLAKWRDLLSVSDLRTNFVDGDIPEAELRSKPLPRVIKAAHFVPKLIEKKLLAADEVIDLLEDSSDETLSDSLMDAVPVLADLGLLSEKTLSRLAKSTNPNLANLAKMIEQMGQSKAEEAVETTRDSQWLNSLNEQIEIDLQTLHKEHSGRIGKIPEARIAWQKSRDERKTIEDAATQIYSALNKQTLSVEEVKQVAQKADGTAFKLVVIRGLGKFLGQSVLNNPAESQKIYGQLEPIIIDLLHHRDQKTKELIEASLYHLADSGVISEERLKALGLKVPGIDSEFKLDDQETAKEFLEIAKAIEADEKLAEFILPISIMYGSKVKGYGTDSADIDVAVFIKPETPFAKRKEIQKTLESILKSHKIKGGVLELWLEDNGQTLQIKDFENPDNFLGDSSFVNVLFGGVWGGDQKAIQNLYEKLLTNYLKADDTTKEPWLRELERDSLQYRLMHKGYSRFYPEQGGIQTQNSRDLDSDSTFWDSGYRRLATKLFLKKVFLPKM